MKSIPTLFICLFTLLGRSNSKITQHQNTIADTLRPFTVKACNKCFAGVDTSGNPDLSTTCITGTYKVIDNKYILYIPPFYPDNRWGKCYDIFAGNTIELWIYNGNASLQNICTDMFYPNMPQPIKKLKAIKGIITFGFTYDKKWKETIVTVIMKDLLFINTDSSSINFPTEVIWKTIDQEMPG